MKYLLKVLALTMSVALVLPSYGDEIKICAAYKKKDNTYSHGYKLTADIKTGAQILPLIKDGYEPYVNQDSKYLHISWKKGGHTFIDLKGDTVPKQGLISEDEKGKEWVVKSGWYKCN